MTTPPAQPGRNHQAPRGTRDFYPIEMARRLWLEDKWRRTATRHGFDEISGPTFEHLDLYTVKSGEGIVSELFSFTREGGETAYALRPEFTPTLARMVATKANALPKPIKWHSIGPYFRAERPQRGRLREFTQWNVDIIGDASPSADAEAISCCIDAFRAMGLQPEDLRVRVSSREILHLCFEKVGIPSELHTAVLVLLDRREKMDATEFGIAFGQLGLSRSILLQVDELLASFTDSERDGAKILHHMFPADLPDLPHFLGVHDEIIAQEAFPWCEWDLSIVRGLAYYTGTVFEVPETGGKERAIAGGGRYDNLVELFGGPPTPAVGFAMGDVVIALVLQDKGLMPSDDAIARDMGLAPDVFVIASEEAADAHLRPVLAHLRRAGLHARRSYKSTRNVGKLLGEASKANARYALILKPDLSAELKDMNASNAPNETLGPTLNASDLAAVAAQRIAPPRL